MKPTTKQIEHIVDCNTGPFIPNDWRVEFQQRVGRVSLTREGDHLFLNGREIVLHLSPDQMNNRPIDGEEVRRGLAGMFVLPANVLDYLRAHPELIPEWWKVDEHSKTRLVFFWGTEYRNSYGYTAVRFLCFGEGRWLWGIRWIGFGWHINNPAAVLAS